MHAERFRDDHEAEQKRPKRVVEETLDSGAARSSRDVPPRRSEDASPPKAKVALRSRPRPRPPTEPPPGLEAYVSASKFKEKTSSRRPFGLQEDTPWIPRSKTTRSGDVSLQLYISLLVLTLLRTLHPQ